MRALRTGIPLLHIKPESAYPALELAPPLQERPYPAHKQAHQKILEGHIHGSSSFHSMDMVPLRGSLDGTQRKDRANLIADSSAPLLPEDSSNKT